MRMPPAADGGVLRFWPFFIVLLLGAWWKVVARTLPMRSASPSRRFSLPRWRLHQASPAMPDTSTPSPRPNHPPPRPAAIATADCHRRAAREVLFVNCIHREGRLRANRNNDALIDEEALRRRSRS